MKEFFLIFSFLLGLFIGSFLNCIIYRLKTEKSFLRGRSFCPHCKHILSWKDLIPVLSFILLKGKCRYCKKKISFQYPLVELSTGLFFSLYPLSPLFHLSQDTIAMAIISSIFYFLIVCFSIIIFVFDLKYYLIPDRVIYPAILVSFIYLLYFSFFLFDSKIHFYNSLLVTFSIAFFFFSLWFFSKGKAMGFGDWEVAVFLGFFLGYPKILISLFLSFFIGALVGLILICFKKKTLKSEIPFAPFLIIGCFLSFFLGDFILDFIKSFFF